MKVLIAVDESETAEKAFSFYLKEMHRPDYELVIVHAGERPNVPIMRLKKEGSCFSSDSIMEIVQQSNERLKALQDKYEVLCHEAQMKHKSFFQTTEHFAGERIVALAAQEHCDVIVMGSRGLGLVRRTILGSVSNYVVHHTKIPVVVCPKH